MLGLSFRRTLATVLSPSPPPCVKARPLDDIVVTVTSLSVELCAEYCAKDRRRSPGLVAYDCTWMVSAEGDELMSDALCMNRIKG